MPAAVQRLASSNSAGSRRAIGVGRDVAFFCEGSTIIEFTVHLMKLRTSFAHLKLVNNTDLDSFQKWYIQMWPLTVSMSAH